MHLIAARSGSSRLADRAADLVLGSLAGRTKYLDAVLSGRRRRATGRRGQGRRGAATRPGCTCGRSKVEGFPRHRPEGGAADLSPSA